MSIVHVFVNFEFDIFVSKFKTYENFGYSNEAQTSAQSCSERQKL